MPLAIFAVLMIAYGLIAARLDRLSIGPALAFVLCGLVVGNAGLDLFDFPFEVDIVVVLAEFTLALVLFSDAASLDTRGSRHDAPVVGRLLAIGLPLSILLGALAAILLFPGIGLPVALLVGAILAPTDAALASAIVTNPVVPIRVRRILNVESGLNDGIASPFVVLFTILVTTPGGGDGWLVDAIVETGTAVIAGLLVGLVGGWLLMAADRHRWTSPTSRQVAYAAFGLAAFALSSSVDGNGFIAAFVAGLAFRRVTRGRLESAQHLSEGVSVLLSIVVWLLFGAVLAGSVIADGLVLAGIIYAAISLTVVRMLPVAIAMVGSHLRRETVLFVGWFGPRGLASVAFGVTAVVDLEAAGITAEPLRQAITWTVLLSVVLHGLTARAMAMRFGDDTASAGGIEEMRVSSRARWVVGMGPVEPPT